MRLLEGLAMTLCVGVSLSLPLHPYLNHDTYGEEQVLRQKSLQKRGRLQDALFVTVNGIAQIANWAMGAGGEKLTAQQKRDLTDISDMLDENDQDFKAVQKCVEKMVLESRRVSWRGTTKEEAFERCMEQRGRTLPGEVRYPYPLQETLKDEDIRYRENTIDVTPKEDKEITGDSSTSSFSEQRESRSSHFSTTLKNTVGKYFLPNGGGNARPGTPIRLRPRPMGLRPGL